MRGIKGEIKVTYDGGGSITTTTEESSLEDEIVPNNETATAMADREVSTLKTRGTLSPKELMGTMSLEVLDAMKGLVTSVLARIVQKG